MTPEHTVLLQFYTLPDQQGSGAGIRNEFRNRIGVLRDDEIQVKSSKLREFALGRLEGKMLVYFCDDGFENMEEGPRDI